MISPRTRKSLAGVITAVLISVAATATAPRAQVNPVSLVGGTWTGTVSTPVGPAQLSCEVIGMHASCSADAAGFTGTMSIDVTPNGGVTATGQGAGMQIQANGTADGTAGGHISVSGNVNGMPLSGDGNVSATQLSMRSSNGFSLEMHSNGQGANPDNANGNGHTTAPAPSASPTAQGSQQQNPQGTSPVSQNQSPSGNIDTDIAGASGQWTGNIRVQRPVAIDANFTCDVTSSADSVSAHCSGNASDGENGDMTFTVNNLQSHIPTLQADGTIEGIAVQATGTANGTPGQFTVRGTVNGEDVDGVGSVDENTGLSMHSNDGNFSITISNVQREGGENGNSTTTASQTQTDPEQNSHAAAPGMRTQEELFNCAFYKLESMSVASPHGAEFFSNVAGGFDGIMFTQPKLCGCAVPQDKSVDCNAGTQCICK